MISGLIKILRGGDEKPMSDFRNFILATTSDMGVSDDRLMFDLKSFLFPFDCSSAIQECQWLLDRRIVFYTHHDWRLEQLSPISNQKMYAEGSYNAPVVFCFTPERIVLEIDAWNSDCHGPLNEIGQREFQDITGLTETDFLAPFHSQPHEFWGVHSLKPEAFLKAAKWANLATHIHGNPQFKDWFHG